MTDPIQNQNAPAQNAENSVPTTARRKILFVDDDKFLLDMYSMKFTKAGYETKAIDTTENAIKLLEGGFEPDAMLIDIVMPGMDGLEFVEAVRARNLAPKSAIIMLTNQGASGDVGKAQKMGVDGYIVKATTIPSDVLAEVEKITAAKHT